ncbi:MAG TPA: flagellar protein FlgN [Clostridia bacterium]|nr:flagellar protein FlgN [Clostridia bacterium]
MVNVDKEVSSVIEILGDEYDYYRDMLELSKSKKKIIVEGKVAELDKIVKLEQNMIFNIGQLEKKREEAVARLCKDLELNSGITNISELMQALQPEHKKQLEDMQLKLRGILSELKTINDINGQLIEQSLEYIDYSINLLAGTGMETGSLYEDIGKNKSKQRDKNIFDTKV